MRGLVVRPVVEILGYLTSAVTWRKIMYFVHTVPDSGGVEKEGIGEAGKFLEG
jgi:hypothetical protein